MRGRKRKTNDVATKRATRLRAKKEETEILSLPIISAKKIVCNESVNAGPSQRMEESSKVSLPKVKITCVPLNVEEIIDYENNKVIINQIRKVRSTPVKKSGKVTQTVEKKAKTITSRKMLDSNKKFLSEKLIQTRFKVNEIKKIDYEQTSEVTCRLEVEDEAVKKSNFETLTNESEENNEDLYFKSSTCAKEVNINEQSIQETTCQSDGQQSSSNLSNKTLDSQQSIDYLSCYNLDDESAFLELNDVNLEELNPTFEDSCDEVLKIVWNKSDITDEATFDPSALNSFESAYLGYKGLSKMEIEKNQISCEGKTLQAVVENFLNNPELKCFKKISALKKGLCLTWLSNNYICTNKQCIYSHCALKLFTKKLRNYSSKFILNIVVTMRNDILFVDAIMAAFKILRGRKIPSVWITFLVYFVFYVTEPSDSRFLKFWANAARFYCQLGSEFAAANGFASLLSIFSKCEKSEEWKVIEFIKLIKQPPVQVTTNYELLQPVLKLDLPKQFLTEAVESCITTQRDVLKVYTLIIPKISFNTSPIRVIELLLKFCITLEVNNLKGHSEDLKMVLRDKVKLFKTKITHHDYPLTAAFQRDIFVSSNEENSLITSQTIERVKEKETLKSIHLESNFFQIENDFCDFMAQTVEAKSTPLPDAMKIQSYINIKNKKAQDDDVSERQIARMKQFFRNCQFDSLGKYLNVLRGNILERAAEDFLKLLFQMKISLQQLVDLIRIIILPCKSENSFKVIASICITLVFNLVRINEWNKAYAIVSLCEEKEINLIEGKVFYFNEVNTVTQCRIALLLIEINMHKENFHSGLKLIKKHFLFSSDTSLWKLTWKAFDKTIRVRILEEFLQQIILKQLTETVFDLFVSVWKDQKQLSGTVDLRKFVDEVLILLLNEKNKEALMLYETIKAQVQLKEITTRAILVTLVRCNQMSAAKSLAVSEAQNIYSLPDIAPGSATMKISSSWLEEEIFIIFDAFFELLANKKRTLTSTDNVEINVQILESNMMPSSIIRPLCLGIINPSFKYVCQRIQQVLYQFNPPVKLFIMPYNVKLDDYSLQVHLYSRVCSSSRNTKMIRTSMADASIS